MRLHREGYKILAVGFVILLAINLAVIFTMSHEEIF